MGSAMESSRIFVKGLPPNLSDEEFKKHFSKQCAITDAKVIPHRRIGYVGYKSSEEAKRAVKYYHRSFIRMSRIYVEIARSVEDQECLRTGLNSANRNKRKQGHTEYESSLKAISDVQKKRKQDLPKKGVADRKFQEFLEVMQPPSKARTWQNQDLSTAENLDQSLFTTETPNLTDAQSDGKHSELLETTGEKYENASSERAVVMFPVFKEGSSRDEETASLKETAPGQAEGELTGEVTAVSDADWLRSRTSRLLGLVDDDETNNSSLLPQNQQSQAPEESKIHNLAQIASKSTIDYGTKEETHSEEPFKSKVVSDQIEYSSVKNGRLFVRNLTYSTTEDELRRHFESSECGTVEEVRLACDSRSGQNKGFAHVQYTEPKAAAMALEALDRKPFQGRMLHIMPSSLKKETGFDEFEITNLPLKKQQQIKRKAAASSSTFNWNSMYMNSDAVMSSMSDRLGISKSELLGPTSSDAAVKQAHAETHVIQEAKAYFTANGVNLDAFKRKKRGDTAILVKNFSYGTKNGELKELFETYGRISKFLMPPSGTMAIVEFSQADEARSAFSSLAYRKFKDSILFLEKAPNELFGTTGDQEDQSTASKKSTATELLESGEDRDAVNTSTLFIRNINFTTSTDRLRETFQSMEGFTSAKVKMKPDPKRQGQFLSMGFGFLEFRSKDDAQAALAAMDGYRLDGHELLIRASHKSTDAAQEIRKKDHVRKAAGRNTKIIIKNLPFEASKKEVRSLFEAYGQLRSVRLPKKFDRSARGFAFADFVTAKEAENAMEVLKNTHLLGRKLILEFAAEDATDPEQEIEIMQQKVGRQADKVALQRLTGTGRKKFTVEELDQG